MGSRCNTPVAARSPLFNYFYNKKKPCMAPAWPGSAAGAWTREGRGLGGVASPLPGAPRGACAVRAVPVRRGGHVGARAVPARHRAGGRRRGGGDAEGAGRGRVGGEAMAAAVRRCVASAERRLGRVGRHGPHQGVRQGGGLLQGEGRRGETPSSPPPSRGAARGRCSRPRPACAPRTP